MNYTEGLMRIVELYNLRTTGESSNPDGTFPTISAETFYSSRFSNSILWNTRKLFIELGGSVEKREYLERNVTERVDGLNFSVTWVFGPRFRAFLTGNRQKIHYENGSRTDDLRETDVELDYTFRKNFTGAVAYRKNTRESDENPEAAYEQNIIIALITMTFK